MPSFVKIFTNPYVLLATALAIALIVFRRQVGETLGFVGSNLGTAGQGIQTFISSVSSPSINPTIGLNLGGVFGDIQSGLNSWYRDTYGKGNQNSNSKNSAPVSAGGFNVVQSTSESGGTARRVLPSGSWLGAYGAAK